MTTTSWSGGFLINIIVLFLLPSVVGGTVVFPGGTGVVATAVVVLPGGTVVVAVTQGTVITEV